MKQKGVGLMEKGVKAERLKEEQRKGWGVKDKR